MVWALLPLLFFSFILGIVAIERDLVSIKPPAVPQTISSDAAGQEFMAYRNAVITYAETKMGSNSYPNIPIPTNLLGLSPSVISALPADASNAMAYPVSQPLGNITPSAQAAANHGYYVCVWMRVPTSEISRTVSELGGDLTIGTVLDGGASWRQAGLQGQTLTIPATCLSGNNPNTGMPNMPPAGDMISIVGITENAPGTTGRTEGY